MTVHDFWHGDMDLLYAYHKAYYANLHTMAYVQADYFTEAVYLGYGNAWSKGRKTSFSEAIKLRDIIEEENERRLEQNNVYRKQKAEHMSRKLQMQNLEWI